MNFTPLVLERRRKPPGGFRFFRRRIFFLQVPQHILKSPSCHVAADTFKIDASRSTADAALEEGDGGEVWPEWPGICANVTFEAVPADLIGSYLTEKGPLTAGDLRREVAAWRALWREVHAAGARP